MKAIQTFWASTSKISELKAGWIDARFHLMSWALSALLLKKYFPKVELYTDELGKEILFKSFQLPYDNVYVTQEKLKDTYPRELWVMRKMHTFSLQNEPFLHVDGDAFFFRPLSENLMKSDIVVQNFQYGFQCYPKAIEQLKSLDLPIPEFVDQQTDNCMNAVNMGIAGGIDNVFFKTFFEKMVRYINVHGPKILQHVSKIETGYLNTFLEECCFYNYAATKGKTITPFFNKRFDDTYSELGNLLTDRYGYFHLIGQHKRDLFYCKLVQHNLRILFPDVYRRIVDFINSSISSREEFQYGFYDPFSEANSRLKNKKYPDKVSRRNYMSAYKKYRDLKETQICETILYEKEKHDTTIEQIALKTEYRLREENRFEFYENYLSKLTLHLRLSDHIQYTEDSAVFNRKVTEGVTSDSEIRLSLVFDFDFGFEHSKEKIWDDFSIFILCMASLERISIRQLVTEVFKSARPVNSRQKRNLLKRMDIRIKELFLLGLIDYTLIPQAKQVDRQFFENSELFGQTAGYVI